MREKAQALLDLNRFEELRDLALASTVSDPDDLEMRWYLTEAYLELGDASAAQNSAEKAVASDPASADFAVQLAQARFALGERRSALEPATAAVRLDPSGKQALLTYLYVATGVLYQTKRDERELWAAVEGARDLVIKDFPAEAMGHFYDAWIHFSWGRHGHAITAIERALAIDPNHVASHEMRGQLLQSVGRVGEAGSSFLSAGRLDLRSSRHRANIRQLVEGRAQGTEFLMLVLLLWSVIGATVGLTLVSFVAVPIGCLVTRPVWRRFSTRDRRRKLDGDVMAVFESDRSISTRL